MDSTETIHEILKCPNCGKHETYRFNKELGFIECVWCNIMMDIDKAKELARKEWL